MFLKMTSAEVMEDCIVGAEFGEGIPTPLDSFAIAFDAFNTNTCFIKGSDYRGFYVHEKLPDGTWRETYVLDNQTTVRIFEVQLDNIITDTLQILEEYTGPGFGCGMYYREFKFYTLDTLSVSIER